MANDCLVTKLKGTVQNDNLPVLNQLKFNVNSGSSTNAVYLIVREGKTLHIASTVLLHKGSPSGQELYSDDIAAGIQRQEVYYYNGAGTITINGNDIYDLLSLATVSGTFPQGSGVDSAKYFNTKGLCLSSEKNIVVANPNVKILRVAGADVDVSELNTGVKLLVIDPTLDSQTWFGLTDNNNVAGSYAFEGIRTRVLFSLDNLPTTMKLLRSNTSGTSGSVESYVAKCVAAGRTSGTFAISPAANAITYNGTLLSELVTAGTVPVANATYESTPYVVVSWENNNIKFLTTLPAELDNIHSALASPGYWYQVIDNY